MKAVAIICEYNPFHKGHAYLLSEVKKRFPEHTVISVMSGAAVQRGELAVYGKYYRAKCAILGGSDIVVELPFPYSCSAGEQFARAGVYIAEKLGAEYLVFGSESGDVENLKRHANNLLSSEFDSSLGALAKANPDKSFIRLRESLYYDMFGERLPIGGNDMLGLEYIKAICSIEADIRPSVIKRLDGYSATESRRALSENNLSDIKRLIPNFEDAPKTHPGLRGIGELIIGTLRLGNVKDNGSGIVNSLISCAEKTSDYDEFISLLPTASYTSARLRRELIAALFGVSDEMKNKAPAFTVLLGASALGTAYLASIRKTSELPILTKQSELASYPEISRADFELCERLESIYRLASGDSSSAFFERPFIMK